MHAESYNYVAKVVRNHKLNREGAVVVEVGSYDVNGSVRPLFDNVDKYVGIDKRDGPGVDHVGDGATYKPGSAPDVVVSTSAIEHYDDPQAVIVNAHRILKPGGYLVLTTVGHPWGRHSDDGTAYDPKRDTYSDITVEDVSDWLAELEFEASAIESTPAGDILCWARKAGGK